MPRELFSELLIKSRYSNSPHFSLRYRLNDNYKPKIGVSVSKKVSKSAVVRNTIRRRVYSSIEPFLENIGNGLFLFVAKPGSYKLKGESLSLEIKTLLIEAGLIVGSSK